MKQLRGFKYRIYPTSAQRLTLAQTFGCTRFVFNWALNLRSVSYKKNGESISYSQTSKKLTQLKKEEDKKWLKDVSSVPLQQSLKALDAAFKRFFKKQGGYPKFKRKSNRQSITYQPNAYSWSDGQLTLAKIKQPLKIKWSRRFEGEPKQVTISKDPSGRYFVSFLVEEELKEWDKVDSSIGIDLGIKDVIVTSKGFASGNPRHFAKYQAKLKRLQRRLKNKQKGSNRWIKQVRKIAKCHAKIAETRKDFLHKLTTKLVQENQLISVETLNVKGMMANHKLAKHIADCGWGELTRQLEYKCQWHERILVKIARWYPSSKTCNECGYIMDKLPLSIREWTCPGCNTTHSRDINAAKNILEVGATLIARGVSSNGELVEQSINSSYGTAKRESPTIGSSEVKTELVA